MCGQMFEAQKVTTKYCSHRCNSKHYKLKVRLEQKGNIESSIKVSPIQKITGSMNALDAALLREQEFLTVKEVAYLLRCHVNTIYRLVSVDILKATRLSERKILIKRSSIDNMFI